eukprot:TRINITY_DN43469_c0_g1_i1.p1 TRINITY_DN43469_c0_g1~~TRINITY_DN43469_c0_g1_i1.p1  ORF type:complete len:196 (+),score=49.70 TRINITY_DN43469_c0_g1_i1:47-634(+)
MGGDLSKISKDTGVPEAELKKQADVFKKMAGSAGWISKQQYAAYRSDDKSDSQFDMYCKDGKMKFREFAMANAPPKTSGARTTSGAIPNTSSKSKLHGSGGRASASADEDREKRAAAAEARLAAAAKRGTGSKPSEASMTESERRVHNQKQELVGKIRALLQALKEDEPFGLMSMSPEKLQNYHQHLASKRASSK